MNRHGIYSAPFRQMVGDVPRAESQIVNALICEMDSDGRDGGPAMSVNFLDHIKTVEDHRIPDRDHVGRGRHCHPQSVLDTEAEQHHRPSEGFWDAPRDAPNGSRLVDPSPLNTRMVCAYHRSPPFSWPITGKDAETRHSRNRDIWLDQARRCGPAGGIICSVCLFAVRYGIAVAILNRTSSAVHNRTSATHNRTAAVHNRTGSAIPVTGVRIHRISLGGVVALVLRWHRRSEPPPPLLRLRPVNVLALLY